MTALDLKERAASVERNLAEIVSGIICVAQEWDARIDCLLKLPDGTIVGEMIPVVELTSERIRATGERLKSRAEGKLTTLVNEIRAPTRLEK